MILNKNIKFGRNLSIKKRPIISIKNGGCLKIGNNVKLNSNNNKYHINLFRPVKIMINGSKSLISIGDNCRIHGSCLNAINEISIGANCLIAANCQILDNSGHDIYESNMQKISSKSKKVVIEDNVWIGTGSIILPGTKIGRGSVVSAGSVVRGSFDSNSLIAGNPSKTVKIITKRL